MKMDAGWTAGMNTIRHPWLLGEQQYRRGVNIVNRGGIAQTRPGYMMRLILPAGNLQGMEHFQVTKNDVQVDHLVFAVNGNVYAMPFPLAQPRSWEAFRLKNISFNAKVPMVHLCTAEKTVQTLADSTVQIVPTYNVLMMQDGINAAAYWDGELNGHLNEAAPTLETPRGTWMAFSGGRLWIARGRLVIASDLLDPLKFVERTQGQGRGDFSFRREITGLTSFMGDSRVETVVVFTDERSEILNSGVRDRTKWASTSNFQSILFPSTGCVAGRSITFQAGLMWWYAQGGLVSSDAVASSTLTSQVNFKDAEMAFSKQFLSDDQSGICGLSFENYLLMSMPIGQNLNSETFVLDYSPMSESSGDKIPAWSGVWTGIRPIQWATALIGTKRRAFVASVDYSALSDGSHNHVWEAFMPEREDIFFELDEDFTTTEYRQQIYCEFETRLLGDGADLKKFSYAEIDASEIGGDVTVRIDYRGRRGSYKQVACKKILAPTSVETSGVTFTDEQISTLGTMSKQSRKISTQEDAFDTNCSTCESDLAENLDKAFSILVHWCGQLAIESVRMFMDAAPETSLGKPDEDESRVCIVGEDGISQSFERDANYIPTEDLYATTEAQLWLSTQSFTQTIACDEGSVTGPISVTATATYRSKISQADADARALQAATQSAQNQTSYLRTQYPCYWDSVQYSSRTCDGELNASIKAMARQSSTGRTILGGDFWLDKATSQGKITARAADGTRVTDWVKQNGFLATPIVEPSTKTVTAIVEQSDGCLVVVGNFAQYTNQTRTNITRLLPDGQIDPTVIYSDGFNAAPFDAIILSDDSIIVIGDFTAALGTTMDRPIAKILADGTLDAGYSSTHASLSAFTKVLAISKFPGSDAVALVVRDTVGSKVRVLKLLADGTQDATFTPYEITSSSVYASCAIQPDGKVVASYTNAWVNRYLVRLNTNGSIDSTFGVTLDGLNLPARDVKIDSAGYIYLGGPFSSYNGTAVSQVIRLVSTGALDATFAAGSFAGGDVYRLLLDEENSLVLVGGGFTSYGGDAVAKSWARLTLSGAYVAGTLSTTQGGAARSSVGQADADAQALAIAQSKALAVLPCV